MINPLFTCFIVGLISPQAAAAEAKGRISGQAFGNNYILTAPAPEDSPNYPTSPFLQNQLALWLDGQYTLNRTTTVQATLTTDVRAPTASGDKSSFQGGVREAFGEFFNRGLGVKIGRQILSWGKSDGINPTDYFSAFDYTTFNPDQEYQRLGTNAVVLNYSPDRGRSPLNFTAVYVAVPPRSKILQAATNTGDQFKNRGDADPELSLRTPEGAVKASYMGRGWDLSLSAFFGQNHKPSFRVVDFSAVTPPSLSVEQYYQTTWAVGGDFSIALGQWVLQGEGAYTMSRDVDPAFDPTILPDRFDGVLGLERPIGEFFRVAVQVIYRYIPNWIPPETIQASGRFPAQVLSQIADANQLIEGIRSDIEVGYSLRADFNHPASGLDFQIFVMQYYYRGDLLLRPLLTYHWTEALKLNLGLNYFSGPFDSPFGIFRQYNSVFTGAIYTF